MQKHKIFKVIRTILLVGLMAFCAEKTIDTPSKEQQIHDELQTVLGQARTMYNTIGISAVIMLPNEEIIRAVSGISQDNIPISADMQFGIGSITKTYIAALVLLLVEENIISLEDPLHKWIPVYPNIDSTITIRQLLNHTSGICAWHDHPTLYSEIMTADLSRIWTREELLSQYIPEPYFPPGTGWKYSSTNYILLGLIIKNATGSEPSTLLQQKIFMPLGLTKTCLYPELPSGEVAQGWYDWNEDGELEGNISVGDMEGYWSLSREGGAMFSTAEEIVKWFYALFHGRVLSHESMDEMLTLVPIPDDQWLSGYGLGMTSWGPQLFGDVENYGHSGAVIGYIGWVQYLPEYDICIAQLENDNKYESEMYINREMVRIIQENFEKR